MGMSFAYGSTRQDEEESIKTLHHAFKIGVNFLDSADMYGFGHNEELIGKAIASYAGLKREDIVIATKFSFYKTAEGGIGMSGSPDYVQKACEASLQRLGLDYIDLYYQHRVDSKTPIEETVKAMADLVKQGKVKYLGLSECSVETLRKAHAIHPITAVQTEYSLWALEPENGMLQACKELGVTFVAYSPLGRGFLTGSITKFEDLEEGDWRRTAPRFFPENFGKNLELVNKIKEIAQEKNCAPSQLALAWLLQQEGVVPIPGTKRIKYLDENVAAEKVRLTADDNKKIREVLNSCEVVGERYPAYAMGSLNK